MFEFGFFYTSLHNLETCHRLESIQKSFVEAHSYLKEYSSYGGGNIDLFCEKDEVYNSHGKFWPNHVHNFRLLIGISDQTIFSEYNLIPRTLCQVKFQVYFFKFNYRQDITKAGLQIAKSLDTRTGKCFKRLDSRQSEIIIIFSRNNLFFSL